MDENLEEQLPAGPQEQPEGPRAELPEELQPDRSEGPRAEQPDELRPELSEEPQPEQPDELRPELSEEPQPEQPDDPQRPGSNRAPAKRDPSAGLDLYLNVRVLVGMMAVFVLLFTFVARIIVVSGPSMENTLIERDLILVWSLGYTPRQGDIVVLTQESYQEDSIVKRVIAVEGQRVDIDYSSGIVFVDNTPLKEKYTKEQMLLPSYGEGINHVTVPEGCIFVMGDNRNNSADSRYPDIGIVDARCVIGHGLAVVFPFNHWKGL